MSRASQRVSSSQSSSSLFEEQPMEDPATLFRESDAKIYAEHRRLANEAIVGAKKDVESVLQRYIHAVNVTHKVELNEIYTALLSSLNAQDAKLAELWSQLVLHDKEGHMAIEGLLTGLEGTIEAVGKIGKGCWATINNQIDENKGIEVVSIGFGGKRPRKTDETLVNSDDDEMEA